MKQGDFTELAKYYVDRPGYSIELLEYIKNYLELKFGANYKVADVGAGTGKLTENLAALGMSGYAVEPNAAMREQGMKMFSQKLDFEWVEGSAENTKLPEESVSWVLMGSSFHWTDSEKAVKEFHRILKPNGLFTAIWNPRDIERSDLHKKIENVIYEKLPDMKRVSSGRKVTTEEMSQKLLSSSHFDSIVFMEAPFVEKMTKERYMNIWKSVNDIQAQAGEKLFHEILEEIEDILKDMTEIEVPYLARAWTVRVNK